MTTTSTDDVDRSDSGVLPGDRDPKEIVGRIGLAGRGVLYVAVGLMAVQLALGDGGSDTDQQGALKWIAEQPGGRVLLVVLTVSLFATAAWRVMDAAVGDPVEGDDATKRVRFAAKGVVYLSLAIAALSVTISNWTTGSSGDSGGGGGQKQKAASTVMDLPGGRYLVAVVGLGVVAFGLYMVKKQALDQSFTERLTVDDHHWVGTLGRAGYAGRAAAFVLVGWFLVQAGVNYEPEKAEGLSQALRGLGGSTVGQIALWFVAVGLVAFGLYNLAEARYRRDA